MTAVLFDAALGDAARRQNLYAGDILVYSARPESLALCEFTQQHIRTAFGSLDPELAQFEMPVHEYAAKLAELKPRFIHHAETRQLVRSMLRALDFDAEKTYFDVPRLRSSTSHGYLTTGIAYAFHPHRDTWYSAPLSQVNLWMPVFAARTDNIMAFHPRHWHAPVPNDSAGYDYQRWNATSRFNAAQHIGTDTRFQPRALAEPDIEPDIRVLTPVGGVKLFSAAHLHSSLPNHSGRTRFSIDLRIVNIDDVAAGIGAPNLDSNCTGTSLTDFRRLSDLAPVDDGIVRRYMAGHPQRARVSA